MERRPTRFEITRVISARAFQLALGAQPFVKTDVTRAEDIAKVEFSLGVIPFKVELRPPFKVEKKEE